MGLISERLQEKVKDIILPIKKVLLPPIQIPPDVSSEQAALETSINEKAHIIADNIRKFGKQEFGPTWAQGYTVLADGRIVFLQHSPGDAQVDESLVIDIKTPNSENRIHIRYDFTHGAINTYRERQGDKLTTAYWIYDRPEYATRIPANLGLHDIINPVNKILHSIEIVSNKIEWNESELKPIIPV